MFLLCDRGEKLAHNHALALLCSGEGLGAEEEGQNTDPGTPGNRELRQSVQKELEVVATGKQVEKLCYAEGDWPTHHWDNYCV